MGLAQIDYWYGHRRVLKGLTGTFMGGRFYGVLGPNGSGKSTLADLLVGLKQPTQGRITLFQKNIQDYNRIDRARRVALVAQAEDTRFPFSVWESVMMGRYPHIPRFQAPSEEDREIVAQVIAKTDLTSFSHRSVTQISCGERQRVVLARALAQRPKVLVLDEATANLDIKHAINLLFYAKKAVCSTEGVVISIFHDINLAAMFCDDILMLKEGEIQFQGRVSAGLTRENIAKTYGLDCQVEHSRFSQTLQVTFKPQM